MSVDSMMPHIVLILACAVGTIVALILSGCRPTAIESPVEHLHEAEWQLLLAADAECDRGGEHCRELQEACADAAESVNRIKSDILGVE